MSRASAIHPAAVGQKGTPVESIAKKSIAEAVKGTRTKKGGAGMIAATENKFRTDMTQKGTKVTTSIHYAREIVTTTARKYVSNCNLRDAKYYSNTR